MVRVQQGGGLELIWEALLLLLPFVCGILWQVEVFFWQQALFLGELLFFLGVECGAAEQVAMFHRLISKVLQFLQWCVCSTTPI